MVLSHFSQIYSEAEVPALLAPFREAARAMKGNEYEQYLLRLLEEEAEAGSRTAR